MSVLIEQQAPRQALHFLSGFGKDRLYPVDDGAEIVPKLDGAGIKLVLGHTRLNGLPLDPGGVSARDVVNPFPVRRRRGGAAAP